MTEDENRIRERAYWIWERENRPFGDGDRHWHLARQMLAEEAAGGPPGIARYAPEAAARPVTPIEAVRNTGGMPVRIDREPGGVVADRGPGLRTPSPDV